MRYPILKTGQKFINSSTGEIVEILETSTDTHGDFIRFRTTLPQGKGFEVEHLHEIADEMFEVESGLLSYKLNGIAGKIGAGEKIMLPRNQSHAHWNADAETLVVINTILPCHDTEPFLETLFGLSIDGKLDSKGTPPFLQVMVWLNDLKSKTFLASIPKGVQITLAYLLSPIAKLLGYRAFYPKYKN